MMALLMSMQSSGNLDMARGHSRLDGPHWSRGYGCACGGGLSVQSPVKLAGLTIGRVDSIEIHPETFQAEVRMVIDDKYDNLPTDSFANIYTSGLLGAQYVEISPGGALESLQDGDRITMTQSAIILESVVSKFLFDKAKE
jgi:phospholipid/cholesterol/gamma-HCH transport system substrate-binding protein